MHGQDQELKEGEEVSALGLWATDKIVAKGTGNLIRGIRIKDSEEAWRITFPGPVCAVTRHVSTDGRTAVVYAGRPSKGDGNEGAAASCGRTAVIDVDTGRKLWDKRLPGEGVSVMSVNVTMTRGAVVAAGGDACVAYDMTSGKRFWADTKPSTCDTVGFAGGRDLLALVQCGNGAGAEYRIQRIAPRSGEPVWTYKAAPGARASGSPPRSRPSSRSRRETRRSPP